MDDKIFEAYKRSILEKKEKRDMEKIHDDIMTFLKENPKPKDSHIHALAEKLGIEPDEFEEHVYMILGSFLGAGKAKEAGLTEKDVDPKELEMGIQVEMEHTSDPKLSKRIALDHLTEITDYYTRLDKMEKDALAAGKGRKE